jgi:hypothetical protein
MHCNEVKCIQELFPGKSLAIMTENGTLIVLLRVTYSFFLCDTGNYKDSQYCKNMKCNLKTMIKNPI